MASTFSLPLIGFFLAALIFGGSSALLFGEHQQGSLFENLQHQQQHRRLRARTDCRSRDSPPKSQPSGWTPRPGGPSSGTATTSSSSAPALLPSGIILSREACCCRITTMHLSSSTSKGAARSSDSGCAETFESETQQQDDRSRRFMDRHQKVRQFRQGDVLALPAGFTLWFYNNGEERLETVALLDTGNEINQLDQTFRNFFLAGKPQGVSQSYYSRQREEKQGQKNNIFNPFDEELLAEIFNVDRETARKLRGEEDERGQIVRADRFNIVFPGQEEEEERRERRGNGFEETFCTAKLRHNIDEPTRADVYTPRGGRISTLNSQKLPILSWLQLSAEKGVLYRNAIMAPHWNGNAHSIIYITRGSGRFQVVGQSGRSVFDGEVREGQLIIVPQNFVVIKKANDEEGLEWISFKTNDNAVATPLAGRLSALRAMPEEVLMNSYEISREDARKLKYRREESRVLSSTTTSRRSSRYPGPVEYALDVIKSMM
ncbi:hypothetical protein C2S51_026804 [Perilla frutescens var. frutescens]|nr:hypothetical protein C2S51_026804 [Perilla frutescens var. frutescens]